MQQPAPPSHTNGKYRACPTTNSQLPVKWWNTTEWVVAAATTVAVIYMLPALFILIQVAVHREMGFGLQQLVAVITLPICAAVILAHVTRKASLYWPFMLYSIVVIFIACLAEILLLVGYGKAREPSQGRGREFGQLLAVIGIQALALLTVRRAYNRMRKDNDSS